MWDLNKKNQKKEKKKCWNEAKCRYCPKINKQGTIKSHSTQRTYVSKTNVNCQSSNLIYCIACKVCGVQYVGQTGRRIIDRFQGHFNSIKVDNTNKTMLSEHYCKSDHNGPEDFDIYILDFIHLNPAFEQAKELRLKIESRWIYRLRSMFPYGLNYLD